MHDSGRRSRVALVGLAAFVAALTVTPSTYAQQATRGAAVVVRGPVRVLPSDVVTSVVALEGPVRVEGVVVGDVVAVGGDVTVTGTVRGDVVALAGVVRLGPTAQVGGDLISPRQPIVARGAQIRGQVQPVGELERAGEGAGEWSAAGYLLGWLGMTVSAILLALLLHWLVPTRSSREVLAVAQREPGKAVGVGLIGAILLPVIALAAMITVVGLPFGVAILIAAGLLAFVGFVAAGWILGRSLSQRSTRGQDWDPIAWVVIGVALLSAVTLIPVVGNLVWIVASMYGVGAIALAFYYARRERRPSEPVTGEPVTGEPVTGEPVTREEPRREPPVYGGPGERPVGV